MGVIYVDRRELFFFFFFCLSFPGYNKTFSTNRQISRYAIGLPVVISNLSPGVGLSSTAQSMLSRPMQRKLVTLVHCQLVEEEGRVRAMRAARSLGERTVTELILQHQNPQQLSSNLWAAVRARGCQFLGPGMSFSLHNQHNETRTFYQQSLIVFMSVLSQPCRRKL